MRFAGVCKDSRGTGAAPTHQPHIALLCARYLTAMGCGGASFAVRDRSYK